MGIPAVLGGVQAVSSVGSSISGKNSQKQAQQAAAQQAAQQQQYMSEIMGLYQGAAADQQRLLSQFDDGGLGRNKIMNQTNAAANALSSIYSRAGANMDQFNVGKFTAPQLEQFKAGFDQGPGYNTNWTADQYQFGDAYDFQRLKESKAYNFENVRQIADLANQNFQATSADVRNTAREQQALTSTQANQALDQGLADRGFSGNSGAAAAALMGLQQQGNQQMSQLERELAAQGRDTALMGAQFDANTAMQMAGMESQYALGRDQNRNQYDLGYQNMASQYGLSRDQMQSAYNANINQLASQFELGKGNLANQRVGQQAQYALGMNQLGQSSALGAYQANIAGQQHNMNAYTTGVGYSAAAQQIPLQLRQQAYENYTLNPMMQGLAMSNPQQMLAAIMGGQQNMTQMYGDAAGAAGTGAGKAQADMWAMLQKLAGMIPTGGTAQTQGSTPFNYNPARPVGR